MTQRSWLADIPENWRILPLKYAVQLSKLRADQRPDDLPYLGLEHIESWTGRILKDFENNDLDLEDGTSTVNLFEPGDVLFGKLRPYLAKACYPNYAGACTTETLVLRTNKDLIDPHYLLYSLLLPGFIDDVNAEAFGSKMPRADWDAIGNFHIAVPPVDTQSSIANFLDQETNLLDTLIAEKQNLLNLLVEKRRAIITSAVTRGINPKAKLKGSGISWLGEIPEYWETRRVAYLFSERDERSQPDLPLLVVSINTGVTLRKFSDDRIENMAADASSYKVARKGDIAFNKMRMWQGAVGVSPTDGLVSPDYVVAEPTAPMDVEYFGLLFKTQIFSAETARHSHGITWDRLRLYWEGFRDIRVPLPPVTEQTAIVEAVKEQTEKLDALKVATEHTIALLRERRTALIAAAVTGKIEIGV